MTIEIQEPDLEAIIQRRIESGRFESPEAVIAEALRASEPVSFSDLPSPSQASQYTTLPQANDLDAMFAEIRGLADDLDFSRIPSTDRPVDL